MGFVGEHTAAAAQQQQQLSHKQQVQVQVQARQLSHPGSSSAAFHAQRSGAEILKMIIKVSQLSARCTSRTYSS